MPLSLNSADILIIAKILRSNLKFLKCFRPANIDRIIKHNTIDMRIQVKGYIDQLWAYVLKWYPKKILYFNNNKSFDIQSFRMLYWLALTNPWNDTLN